MNKKDRILKVALVLPVPANNIICTEPPMFLAHIAACIREQLPNAEIKIFDGYRQKNIQQQLTHFQPNIIGVSAVTPQAPAAYQLLDWVKQTLKTYTVIGGVHASVEPQEALTHADCVVTGEGEKTFTAICKDFMDGKKTLGIIPGVPVENLDLLPRPAYDLLDMNHYIQEPFTPYPKLETPQIRIVTQRGCPYRCRFCYNSYRKSKVRYFSAQHIINELKYLHTKYGVKSVFFHDDDFLVNTTRFKEFAQLVKQEGLTSWLTWGCQARATVLTTETLQLAKSVGCKIIVPGFESGCQKTLTYLKCGTLNIKDSEQAISNAAKIGVPLGGFFIFGSPNESYRDMQESWSWIKKHNNLQFYGVNTLTPYPGTEIYKEAVDNGFLSVPVDYEKLSAIGVPDNSFPYVGKVKFQTYRRFLIDVLRTTWFMSQLNQTQHTKDLLKLFCHKTTYYVALKYPLDFIKFVIKK